MDRDLLREAAPHYVFLLVVLVGVFFLTEDMEFWLQLLIAVSVVTVYRLVVTYLGIAPSIWDR